MEEDINKGSNIYHHGSKEAILWKCLYNQCDTHIQQIIVKITVSFSFTDKAVLNTAWTQRRPKTDKETLNKQTNKKTGSMTLDFKI